MWDKDDMRLDRGGVYRITCSADNSVYIGATKCFIRRWREHRKCLKAGNHESSHLQNLFNVCDVKEFKIEILEVVDTSSEGMLAQREQHHIDHHKCNHQGIVLNSYDSGRTRHRG